MKKLVTTLALSSIALTSAFAAETFFINYDQQLTAVNDPTAFLGARWLHAFADSAQSGSNLNVSSYLDPTVATTTSTPNLSRIITNGTTGFPAGNGTDNCYQLRFGFMGLWDPAAGATPANRSTVRSVLRVFNQTRAAISRPDLIAPALDTTKKLRFDIYSVEPIAVGLLVCEATPPTLTIGVDGNSASSPLEVIGGAGANAINASGPYGGWQIPANTWTTVEVDWTTVTARNFNGGNGVLNPVTAGWISLNSILLMPATGENGVVKSHSVFFDNFRQGEPSGALTGTISANGYAGDLSTRTANVEVFDGAGSSVANFTGVALTSAGAYSITNTLADGTYTVKANIENGSWLRRSASVTVASTAGTANFALPNGDIVDDGVVDIADYSKLALYFDRSNADGDWLTEDGDGISPSECDITGDGIVDIADYSALAAAFDGVDE